MTTLVIGAGLVGSQVARVLAGQGEKPVLMDTSAQTQAIGQIVPLDDVTLISGDILRPLSVVKAINDHEITGIIHTAANPMLTLGAQTDPYSAINLNIWKAFLTVGALYLSLIVHHAEHFSYAFIYTRISRLSTIKSIIYDFNRHIIYFP